MQLGRAVLRSPRRARRRVNARNLAEWGRFRRLEARCNICGHAGRLLYEMPDLELLDYHRIGSHRETVRCRSCQSKMRDRTVAAGLLEVLGTVHGVHAATIDELASKLPDDIRILDTDANGRLSQRLSACKGYVRSLYLPERANGEALDDPRMVNVDLEQMPFPDDSFDVIITTEVMEHVRFVDKAHREIARCLDSGGRYVFTVPYDASLATTWCLIDPVTDEPLVHPLHVHGDPGMREEGILSYRVFGTDIFSDLEAAGLRATFQLRNHAEVGIFAGDLFVAEPASGELDSP